MSKIDKLERIQEIVSTLPSGDDDQGGTYRSLTKGDVMVIYRIARIAMDPHSCPFSGDDVLVLQDVAGNITKTRKITFFVLVSGLVGGLLSGLWFTISHVLKEFAATGGFIK
jgi:hypothetical protein